MRTETDGASVLDGDQSEPPMDAGASAELDHRMPGSPDFGSPASAAGTSETRRARAGARGPADKPPSRRKMRQAQRAALLGQRRRTSRYAMVYDTHGPKVRLGFGWFLLVAAALALQVIGYGVWLLGLLYAAVAAVSGLQTSRVWMARRERPHQVVAGVAAAAAPIAAMVNTALAGVVILLLVAAAIIVAFAHRMPGNDPVVDAGFTVRCSLFAAVAATSVVLIARAEVGAVISLLALVSIYEMGDFLVGSGSANPIEGPIAGIVGVAALSFGLSVIIPPPFTEPLQVLVFGALVALTAPIGQLVGSAVLSRSGDHAPALRRLDSLIIVGPVWAVLTWFV